MSSRAQRKRGPFTKLARHPLARWILHLIAALGLVLTTSTTFLFGGGIASADSTPTVTSISPSNGPMAGGTLVTIDGAGLSTVSAVNFGSAAASLFFANSDSELVAVSPGATGPGPVDITVINGAGSSATSSSDVFTYTLAAPTVAHISPTSAAISGGSVVTISGTNFLNGQTSVTVGGITATNVGAVVQNGATSVITAVVPVTTNVGTVDVQVSNPSATSATSSADLLTYTAPVPAVSALAPNNANTSSSTTVTITGTGLINGGTSVLFGSQAALSVGPVSIAGNYTVMTATNPLTTGVGSVDARLTTSGGTSPVASTDKFTYTAGTPAVTAISPLTGTTAGHTIVTITGTNFLNSGSTVAFGGVPAGSVGPVSIAGSNTVMTATSPATTTSGGPVDVTVAITGATSATSASDVFTYTLVTPTVTAISPLTGTVAGKATVTITGTDFVAGATTVTFGGQAAAATGAVKFVGSTTVLTATAPMTTGTGAVDVQVTTPATTSAPVSADHFTYYAGVPSISSVSPNNGASAGGTTVTITGLGLLDGATTVTFGGIAATSVGAVNLSGNSMVMTATSPMTNAAAGVDIKVTTLGGSSALGSTDKFTYTAGTPTVSAIRPLTGTTAGNTTVTITGTGLINGSTHVYFGAQQASSVGPVTVVGSNTVVTATSPTTTTSGGSIDITTSTGGGTSALSSGDVFTYTLVTPTVTAISPLTGTVAGKATVTITGTDFVAGATTVSFGGQAAAATGAVKFVGSTTVLTATAPMTTGTGAVDVQVTTPATTSAAVAQDQFTYFAGMPSISSVSPNNGASAGGTIVTITGLGLLDGATTVTFGGVAATSVGSVSLSGNSTVMTATSPMTNAAVPVDVKVTTLGGSSAIASTDKFTYTTGTPTVTSISPVTGTTAGNTTVTISGTGLLNNATHVYFGPQSATSVGPVRVVGSSAVLTATSPTTATSGGPVDVTVAITGATSSTSASDVFTYTLVTPTVTAISPLTGTVAGKATVTITGTDFVAGATTVSFGGQAAAATGAVKFVGSTTVLTATAPMTTGTGAVDVQVTTPATTSAPVSADHFTYFAGVPSISSVSPNSGASAGGTTVTITGLGLLDGATTVTFGGVAATSVGAVSLSGSSAVMTATSPMTNAAVAVDVRVSTTGGTSAIANTDKFTYTTGTPTVSAISPVTGTTAGNTTVTITGTGLLNKATTVYFGSQPALSVGAVTVAGGTSTVMTATTPMTWTSGGPVHVTVAITGFTSTPTASDVFTYTLVTPAVTGISPSSGTVNGGTTVTITGTNFINGHTFVAFGNVMSTKLGPVKFVGSYTVMTATSPVATASGAVDVETITPAGRSQAVAQDQFTYTGTIGFARTRTNAQHSRRTGAVTAPTPPHTTPHLAPSPQPAPGSVTAPGHVAPNSVLVGDLSPYLPIGQWAELIALPTK